MGDRLFKFCFQAKLTTLSLNLSFPCQISVVWKRGDKLAETKERKAVIRGVVTFDETLEIDCNMAISPESKRFEPKKTILTVLIFTDKGTKQAGEIELDVSEPLNDKKNQKQYELSLNKCPDKNAKLRLTLNSLFRQEIRLDNISQSSYKSVNVVEVAGKINEPDFRKKRQPQPEEVVDPSKESSSIGMGKKALKSQTDIKQNIQESKAKNLEDQNFKLKEDLKQLKKEQERLTKRYEEESLTAKEYQFKNIEGKKELQRFLRRQKEMMAMDNSKKELLEEILACRQKLGIIFNTAFEIGGPQLADYLQEASGYVENEVVVKGSPRRN